MSGFKKSLNDSYVGVSSEEKPTQGIEEFSLFKELDTNDTYYFYNGTWNKMNKGGSGGDDPQTGGVMYLTQADDGTGQALWNDDSVITYDGISEVLNNNTTIMLKIFTAQGKIYYFLSSFYNYGSPNKYSATFVSFEDNTIATRIYVAEDKNSPLYLKN